MSHIRILSQKVGLDVAMGEAAERAEVFLLRRPGLQPRRKSVHKAGL